MKPNKEAAKNEDEKKDRNRSSYSELPDDEESTPTKTNKKEGKNSKEIKESWVFRKSKSSKVKNDPSRFSGEGVNFKAKIIGIENVFDARGNRMCQDALQKLKAAVKTSGEHKQRILLNISLLGIRIKDEKTGEVLHHHPVHKISFISQDASDNRAFGYVFGCPQTGHQFFGIKTEKTAAQVVCTLRDLFHTALELKKKEIEKAMEQQRDPDEEEELEQSHKSLNGIKETNGSPVNAEEVSLSQGRTEEEEHVYSELRTANGVEQMSQSHSTPTSESAPNFGCTVDNLLDLQFEMDNLQQGISQMEHSIASVASVGFGVSFSEDDNSISSGCSHPMTPRKLNRMSSLYHETLSVSSRSSSTSDYTAYTQENNNPESAMAFKNEAANISPPSTTPQAPEASPPPVVEDKYAVFYEIDSLQSIFDNPTFVHSASTEENMSQENSNSLETSNNLNIEESTMNDEEQASKPAAFAELDPLGDHPFVEKEKFFQELKNPPKKVLKDLIGNGYDSGDPFTDFSSSTNSHFNGETSSFPAEKVNNPFVTSHPVPPKLPPKRAFGVTSPSSLAAMNKQENLPPVDEETVPSFKNPYNPFIHDDEFSEIPLPTSPPPPPPPRLPYKDAEAAPPMSPPPRPPNRVSAIPTPPRPRRKVPLGSASCSWFSFDQEAVSASQFQDWNGQPPSSPPLPIPSRKVLPASKFDSSVQKSCSASNSPASVRRYSNINSSSTAFKEFSESVQIGNSSPSPQKKLLTRHTSIVQESWGQKAKSDIPNIKNPFEESSAVALNAASDCAEVKRIMNRSPPLPPKTTGISRPRPSPSRKMLSAPRTSSSTSSAESRSDTVSSSSLRYSSVDCSSTHSGSEALCRNSTSSQSDSTFSSGYNGEISGENVSTESEKTSPTSPDSIFRRKSDPFADDFFLSLPKKSANSGSASAKTNENGDSKSSNHFQVDFDGTKMPAHLEGDVFENKAT